MANYATLKAAIVAAIRENGNKEITGNLLQQQLLAMVNSLGAGYQYAGIATPATNPGTPDQNVFYIASTAGTYANFGGLVLADGEIAILKYNGTWSKDSTGGASLETVNQLDQKVGDVTKTVSFDSSNFANIIYDGSGFIAATGNYNAIVIFCPAGRHIQITAETGVQTIRVFRIKPEIGVTATFENLSQGCWYDADNDAYLHIQCYVSDSPNITANMSYYGIKKDLADISAIVLSNTMALGETKATIVLGPDDYVGMIWAGTYVAKSSARFNAFIIPIIPGCAYKVNNGYSLITFSDYPILGYGDGKERSVSASFTANEGEKFLLITIDLSDYTTINVESDGIGVLADVQQIPLLKATIGETEKNTTLTSDDFCGYFWGGDKIYSATSRYNGFLISLIAGVKYIVSRFQNLSLFSSQPVIGSNAGFIEMLTTGTFVATEQTKYLLITLDPADVPITLFSSGYGIGGKVDYLEKQTQGGKTLCLGDSNTEFGDVDGLRYTDYLELLTGRVFVNAGIGGTRYAGRTAVVTNPTSAAEAYAALDLVNLVHAWVEDDWTAVDNANAYLIANVGDDNTAAINALKNNPISGIDNVIIMAGTNDYGGNTPLGTPGDVDTTTLCGSMGHIFGELLGAKRGLKIYICGTIIRWFVTNGDISTYIPENFSDFKVDSLGKSVIDYNDAIAATAKYYHTPFCDMYYSLGWNMLNFFEYFGEPGVDSWANGTHPFRGYSTIAKRISGFINSHRQ